jgi:hypothetical protein
MKAAILQHGPMATSFWWNPTHHDDKTKVYYNPDAAWWLDQDFCGGHAVLLVGWDDARSDGHGGAGCWIAKNSWGRDWKGGDQGYFYLAYNSGLNLADPDPKHIYAPDNVYYTGIRPYDPNENIYLEDLPGYCTDVGYSGTNVAYGGLVFAPANAGEQLTHVEFFTGFDQMPYTISVYGAVGGPDEFSITFSDLLQQVTGACEEAGYYAIPLPSAINLTQGQQYGVEVKFTAPAGNNSPVPAAWPVMGVVDNFADQGNARGYIGNQAGGPYMRLIYIPSVRARTLR